MRLLTIGETARRLNLAVDTVRRMADDGVIRSERTPGGHRRFREDVVEAHERKQRPAAMWAKRIRPVPARGRAAGRLVQRLAGSPYGDDPASDEDHYPTELPEDPEDYTEEGPPDSTGGVSRTRQRVEAAIEIVRAMQPPIEARTMKHADKQEPEAARLNRYKAHGMICVPHDVPASERSKVIAELDKRVTDQEFPIWVSDFEAMRIVGGLVEEILKAGLEQAQRDAKAAEDKRRSERLIQHGLSHARSNTSRGWDETAAEEALEEVEQGLRAEVKPNWSERRVCERVEDLLDLWDDDEH